MYEKKIIACLFCALVFSSSYLAEEGDGLLVELLRVSDVTKHNTFETKRLVGCQLLFKRAVSHMDLGPSSFQCITLLKASARIGSAPRTAYSICLTRGCMVSVVSTLSKRGEKSWERGHWTALSFYFLLTSLGGIGRMAQGEIKAWLSVLDVGGTKDVSKHNGVKRKKKKGRRWENLGFYSTQKKKKNFWNTAGQSQQYPTSPLYSSSYGWR